MKKLIKLNQVVVVEGKYDKITLSNIIDAIIITTDGFGIFKNKEKISLIKAFAKTKGIVVMTDSDSAGAQIRGYLKGICCEGEITNVYIPQLKGKEKRKAEYSKEGYLGVEGMSREIVSEALKRSGVICSEAEENLNKITKTDLFSVGLSGGKNSAFLRKKLLKFLRLPDNLSANAFLDAINTLFTYEEFFEEVKKWQQEEGKK